MNLETKLCSTFIVGGKEHQLIDNYAPKQNFAYPYGFAHLQGRVPALSEDVQKTLKLSPNNAEKVEEAWKAFRNDEDTLRLAQTMEGISYVNRAEKDGELIDLIVRGRSIGEGKTHKIYEGYSLKIAKFVSLKVVTEIKELEILFQIQTHGKNVKSAYQIYYLFPLPGKENAWLSVDKLYEGNLRQLIIHQPFYDPIKIASDITKSLIFLNSTIQLKDMKGAPLPYSHRDIKPDNILVTKKMRAVLADFNACGYLNGSPLYMSPNKYQLFLEVAKQRPKLDVSLSEKVLNFSHRHSQPADMWALGLVFGNLFAKHSVRDRLPFFSIDQVFQKQNADFCETNDEKILRDIQSLANSLSDRTHQDFVVAILPQMLQFDPEKCISAEDLEIQITNFMEFSA